MKILYLGKYGLMAISVAITSFGGGYLFYLGTTEAISGGIILLTTYVLLQAYYFKIMDTREHIKTTLNMLVDYRTEAMKTKEMVDAIPSFITSEQNKFAEYCISQIEKALKTIQG